VYRSIRFVSVVDAVAVAAGLVVRSRKGCSSLLDRWRQLELAAAKFPGCKPVAGCNAIAGYRPIAGCRLAAGTEARELSPMVEGKERSLCHAVAPRSD